MSEKQNSQKPSESASTPTSGYEAEAVADNKLAQTVSRDGVGSTQSNEPESVSPADANEQAVEASAGELASSSAQEAGGAMVNARRLVVVPGQKGGPAANGQKPLAAQGRRPVPANAPGGARAPVVVPAKKVIPAKTSPGDLQAWAGLAAHNDFLMTMRRTRRRRFFGRLAAFVGIPTLLVALYVFLWATPRYVSEFELTFNSYQDTQSLATGIIQSFAGGSQASADFGAILDEYIQSETLLRKLDEKMNLRAYYSSHHIDYPARLNPNASGDVFLNYYRSHIVDVSEGLGGYLTVDVQAFDPDYAKALAAAIVQACDEMVDQMTARARQDAMRFAEEELAREEDRVRKARVAETKFQNEHGDLNPTNTATQYGQIVASLETQLSQTRTALTNTLTYASPNAPQVQQLKNQVTALETQLKDQRNRLTGGNSTYSQILEEYASLQLEDQFAQNAYLAAQQGLAVARADAARKQGYLIDFVTPNRPSGPARSFYIYYIAGAFFGSLLLYAVGSLIGGAFRDQAGL